MNNKIIIIGDDHHNTLGLVWSFGIAGYLPIVLLHTPANRMVKYSKYISEFQCLDLASVVDFLVDNYSHDDNKPFVLCSTDEAMSVLDRSYNVLSQFFILFNANQVEGRITDFMNKEKMRELAMECGLLCPQTIVINKSNIQRAKDLSYPCMIKAIDSLVAGKEELNFISCFNQLENHIKDGIDYQLQEYIKKDYELLLPWAAVKNGRELMINGVLRKIRQYPWDTGCSSYTIFEDISNYKDLDVEMIKRFVERIGYEGLFSIEFLVKDNRYYFLEINMRNDGTGFVPTYAGYNTPVLWCQKMLGEDVNIPECRFPVYSMIDELDFVHVFKHNVKISTWLRDFFRTNCFLLFNTKDQKPFWGYWFNVLKSYLFKCHH